MGANRIGWYPTPAKYGRVECKVCGRVVKARKDGTPHRHRDIRDWSFQCTGAGKP